MNKENTTGKYSGGERIALLIFVLSSGVFILNILIGKASIVWGWKVYYLGNVGEFLALLIASISIIAVALHREAAHEAKDQQTQSLRKNGPE